MSAAQKAAYITAQAVMMQAEMQVMLAEDREREQQDKSPANGPEEWNRFLQKWETVLGHNAVITMFNS